MMTAHRLDLARRRELRHLRRMRSGTASQRQLFCTQSRASYNMGCRCDECTDAEADYSYVRSQRRVQQRRAAS